jgi:NitT/TauT family transport system ATP-binding protein
MAHRPVQLSIEGVTRSFGAKSVLADLNLEILQGEFLTLFGPNGCGKTTLLNVIAGIETVDLGRLEMKTGSKPRTGYVFQDYRGNLMPWLTVAENIAFPLLIRNVPRAERRKKVDELFARYGFDFDLNAYTYTLSGGQAQLTSILRGLIIDPDMLIMDEPFSALDYQTNLDLYDKVLQVWRETGVTIILVSHNIDEALYLGERTVFLTRRPTRVAAILENNIPGPKDITQFGTEPFAALKARALKVFHAEISTGTAKHE